MRAVLDTNILARAFVSKSGPAAECLNRLMMPPNALLSSAPMLLELERVLAYPRLRALHGMTDEEIRESIKSLALTIEFVDVSSAPPLSIVREDVDDDAVVATAVAGAVNVLCTRDAHFYEPAVVAYCSRRGIRIVDELALLAEIRAAGSADDDNSTPSP